MRKSWRGKWAGDLLPDNVKQSRKMSLFQTIFFYKSDWHHSYERFPKQSIVPNLKRSV